MNNENDPPVLKSLLPKLSAAVLLISIYVATGKVGLALAVVNPSASAVWAPTGIAMAALLVFGYRVWPAFLAGAFVVNMTTSGSVAASLAIAVGNTLEGVIGAYLVNRFANGLKVFERAQDIFKFAVLAGVLATAVSATIGALALALNDLAAWNQFAPIWLTWWLGDITGALLVTPVFVLWASSPAQRDWRRTLEAMLLLVSLLLIGVLMSGSVVSTRLHDYPLEFLALPIVVWSAFRFGQREAATAALILSAMTVWRVFNDYGAFTRYPPNESLLLLQIFMGVVSLNGLILGAVIAERRRAEQSQRWLATIVESSDDAIIGKDLEGVILSWNQAAERIYGYTAEQAIGCPMSMLVPPDRLNEVPQILERIRQGERVEHYETRHARIDRERISVSLTVSPIKDDTGNIVGASTIARDISDRRCADELLHQLRSPGQVLQ